MEKIFWDGGTLLAPLPPALVSCGTMEKANIITIGWTGIINSNPPMTYISVKPERFSFDIIKNSKEFVINLPTENLVKACDWCGVKSGKDVDKFAQMNLTKIKAQRISAPLIGESPVNLECKIREEIDLGSHHMFIADIVGVNVDKSVLDQDGKLHIDRCHLISYAHGTYYKLGDSLGTFGFSVRKKPIPKKRYNK